MNEALWEYMIQAFGGPEGRMAYEQLARLFPQFNHQTQVNVVGYQRTIELASLLNPVPYQPFPDPYYVPTPGMLAWLNRLRARVHKWFVDNEYHPGDQPKGWKPYDISRVGMLKKYPNTPQMLGPVYRRTLEMKRYGFMSNYDPFHLVNFEVIAAYDGATDTLFIRAFAPERVRPYA